MTNITDLHPTPEAEAKQELADIGDQVFHKGKDIQGLLWITWEEDGIDWGFSVSDAEALQMLETVKFQILLGGMIDE